MSAPVLQRMVITFKPEEIVVHALYKTLEGGSQASPEPAELVGTSGFTRREDVLLVNLVNVPVDKDAEGSAA
jgi:hypothetical protein